MNDEKLDQVGRLRVLAEHFMSTAGLSPVEEWPSLERLRVEVERLGLPLPQAWGRHLVCRANGLSSEASAALALGQSDPASDGSRSSDPTPTAKTAGSAEQENDAASLSPETVVSARSRDAGLRDAFPEYSDGANADTFIRDHSRDLIYVAELQTWFVWDKTRWVRDIDGEVERRAWRTVAGMIERALKEFLNAADSEERAAAHSRLKLAERCAQLRTVRQMISTAEVHAKVIVALDMLDADGYLFNCANGTLDLRTGTLRRHNRPDYITKISPVRYDADADAPRFLSFLERIFASDAALISYVQRLLGYAMVGQLVEHILPVAYGSGANGKTTLFEALRHVFGDYAQQATGDLLLRRASNGGPSPDLARLPGARLVLVSETEEGRHWNEALVKQLTGGDRIAARDLYKTLFEFTPVGTIVLTTNHLPSVSATGEAMWRRLRVIPFRAVIPEGERDPRLLALLIAEAEGILRWLLGGALAWSANGLGTVPSAVTESTDAYRLEADLVGRFVDECCDCDPSYAIGAKELHLAFCNWAAANGSEPLTMAMLGRELNQRGFSKMKRGTITRQGLRLSPDSRTLSLQERGNVLREIP